MAHASVKLVTKKKTETHTRDWVIEKVDLFFQQDTRNVDLVHSDIFTLGSEVGKVSDWSLSFSVSDGKLGVYLNLESVSHSPAKKSEELISINCNYILQLGKPGEDFQALVFHKNNRVFTALEGFGTPAMTTIKELFARKNEFFPANSLQIRLILTIVSDPINLDKEQTDEGALDLNCDLTTCWKNNLESLFNCSRNSDLVIRCGGRNFFCHKSILAASLSESKLRQILANVIKVKDKIEEISIQDIQEGYMEMLLRYMYSGQLPALDCTCYRALDTFFQAVEQLQVKDVKTIILRNIANDLDDEKAVIAYRIITKYDTEEDVKIKIVEYCRRRFEYLIKHPEFKLALGLASDLIINM